MVTFTFGLILAQKPTSTEGDETLTNLPLTDSFIFCLSKSLKVNNKSS